MKNPPGKDHGSKLLKTRYRPSCHVQSPVFVPRPGRRQTHSGDVDRSENTDRDATDGSNERPGKPGQGRKRSSCTTKLPGLEQEGRHLAHPTEPAKTLDEEAIEVVMRGEVRPACDVVQACATRAEVRPACVISQDCAINDETAKASANSGGTVRVQEPDCDIASA